MEAVRPTYQINLNFLEEFKSSIKNIVFIEDLKVALAFISPFQGGKSSWISFNRYTQAHIFIF